MKYITKSPEEMMCLGEEIAHSLSGEGYIALSGDLGTGKTTFVKGLARGLGVVERIKSPTFNICSIYAGGGTTLVHIDAYRLSGEKDFENLLIDDIVNGKKLVCIEWPENIISAIPSEAKWLRFTIDGDRCHVVVSE